MRSSCFILALELASVENLTVRREIDIFDLTCISANMLHDNNLSSYTEGGGSGSLPCWAPLSFSHLFIISFFLAIPSFHLFRPHSLLPPLSANESLWKGIKRASHQPSPRRVWLQSASPDISITGLPADTGRDRDPKTQRQPMLPCLDSMNHLASWPAQVSAPGQVLKTPLFPCVLSFYRNSSQCWQAKLKSWEKIFIHHFIPVFLIFPITRWLLSRKGEG